MRALSIFTLLFAAVTCSQAAVIFQVCTPSVGVNGVGSYSAGAGVVTYSCDGLTAPVGYQILSAQLQGFADFTFGQPGTDTFQVSYALPGTFSPSPIVASATGSGNGFPTSSSSSISASANYITVPTLSIGAFQVVGTGSTTAGQVNAGSGSVLVTYTYELSGGGGVPEPSTLALVGGVLVLAGIRKYRS